MTSSISKEPSNKDFFNPQYGYADVNVKTQQYSDKPTPILAHHNNKAAEYISDHADKEHAKKYAQSGGKRIFNMLIGFICH
ncbi:hypothetical protein KGF56_003301 [Candida oxycetoniae]|uniref:Uncharacterized protein n=1 Tax=Candida oxycetoniae TaxID=497107 RepID=A0AAI9SW93_9ASCO|nr:uncharacterized protein KGF56_003301 [Candida oxycetoniae]KAI3403871.2 hypothetical protein KGF56_003301 [Candida oxycetoniae]